MMFFEGSEKKVEAVLKPDQPSLRQLGRPFWENLVAKANATILSSVHNEHCDAYLLSESSLFVWDDRFLMLTCGTTTLVQAVTEFLQQIPVEHLDMLTYQRKNEYQSHLQKSSFDQDLIELTPLMKGQAWRLGHLDGHHNYIFHLDQPYQPSEDDGTSELLMYHIQGDAADYLRSNTQTIEGIRQLFNWPQLLAGFELNDFLFEPFGYSMNAIQDDRYFTVHITPQEESSYVSFESNLPREAITPVFNQLICLLKPQSYDLINFNQALQLAHQVGTQRLDLAQQALSNGYQMQFEHFLLPSHCARSAVKL